jgi:Na+/phosphate symporter
MTLLSDTAYHSFIGEVEALNTTTIRRLTRSRRHQLPAIAHLGGAIALLIWGVHMVQTGITRAFGPQLRRMLSYALGNRFKAFLAGVGVTSTLQSSTATGLMVTAFAAGGLVDLVPALAVMLGANVGTTLIVQVLSFDVSRVSFLFILIGVFMFRRSGLTRTRDLGRVGIGLGLMLIALQHLLTMITPFEDVPSLRMLLGGITTDPRIDIVIAAALTWAAHSSVAVVLLIMAFCGPGCHATARSVRARARGQPRDGSEPAARKRSRRRRLRACPNDCPRRWGYRFGFGRTNFVGLGRPRTARLL